MKLYIANEYQQHTMGGGFVFAHNLGLAMNRLGVELTDTHLDADISIIPGPTMLNDKELFRDMVSRGKPIVLRVDNAVRDSRNRGTGMSRMLKYASAASAIVYQSAWSESFLGPFIQKSCKEVFMRTERERKRPVQHVIIYNGVDTEIFRPDGEKERRHRKEPVYLYSRHNRDELKGWHIAWYQYIAYARAARARKEPPRNPELWIVGNFSKELVEYNFDFFDGEDVKYWGQVADRAAYAKILRSADYFLAPYEYDACPNAVLEAIACGVQVITRDSPSGSIAELLHPGLDVSLDRMGKEYLALFESLVYA